MKHLKEYENIVNPFVATTTEIDATQYNELFDLCCLGVNDKDIPIYRSTNNALKGDFYLIDPRKMVRISAYASNYYTLMIDNSEKWKDYPKRKHSVICAVNESHAGNEYRVYPLTKYNEILKKYNIPYFEESKWGVCPEYDIWESFFDNPFFEHVEDLSEMNEIIAHIYSTTKFNKLEQYDYNIFKSQLESVNHEDVKKLIETSSDMNPLSNEILKILNHMVDNKLNLYEMFDYILDPVKNDFKVELYSELINEPIFTNKEVWSDTPVLYINNRWNDDPDYDENDE